MRYEIIGWIGSVCSVAKSYPQMFLVIRNKNANGISLCGSWIWFVGLLNVSIYTWSIGSKPLLVNCLLNLLPCVSIIYYSYFPEFQFNGRIENEEI